MLTAGQTKYPLCLLDTMVVSEMVKEDASPVLRHFYEWACEAKPVIVPCFTIYTLMELRRAPAVFRRFIERFRILPCVMLKGYAHILEEEVASYPDPSELDPCAIAFTFLGGDGNQLSNLPRLLEPFAEKETMWNKAGPRIVEGMMSLVSNFPPSGDVYTPEEIRQFVWISSLQQLANHDESRSFMRDKVRNSELVEIAAFPSIKAMSFTVFHKFYADRDRQPSNSDAFDVLISGALPYVEAFITENHQAEALRKIKRRDGFLTALEVFTLRDFRVRPPLRPRSTAVTPSSSPTPLTG